MTRLLFALLVLSPMAARADGIDASSLGAFAIATERGTSASLGVGGVTASHAVASGFGFASFEFRSAALELGFGHELARAGRWQAWWSGSGVVAPVGGLTVGARGLVGGSAVFSSQFVVLRPTFTVSAALAGGPDFGATVLAPVELGLDVALRRTGLMPFLRVAAGFDPIAAERITARGTVALGVAL